MKNNIPFSLSLSLDADVTRNLSLAELRQLVYLDLKGKLGRELYLTRLTRTETATSGRTV